MRSVVAIALVLLSPLYAHARSIMVIAPHPDDELLIAAGIIHKAVLDGIEVKVVIVTNGDAFGRQRAKISNAESIAGLALLGLGEEHVIFLGYGDQLLQPLLRNPDPDSVMISAAGASATYAYGGMGGADYHSVTFGEPAPYNRKNVVADVIHVLDRFRPTDIYTMLPQDAHPDHSATHDFTMEGIAALQPTGYAPVLHKSVVHAPGQDLVWPGERNRADLPFPKPDFVEAAGLSWEEIESVPVPQAMQALSPCKNLKTQAIACHTSKLKCGEWYWLWPTYNDWMFGFVRSNEFFWRQATSPLPHQR